MEDKVFLKTYDDGLHEKNPHFAFVGYLIACIIIFFIGLFLLEGFISFLCFIISFVVGVFLPVKVNNDKNISASIGFIKRNNKWFVIKLMYDIRKTGNVINVPSDPVVQSVLMPYNVKVASNVQKAEKRIRNDRKEEQIYIKYLDEVLSTLQSGKITKPLYASVDKKLDYFLNGFAFEEIYTINGNICGYIILDNLKLEKITKKYITISFEQNNQRKKMKFRNVYEGLIDEIKNENIKY